MKIEDFPFGKAVFFDKWSELRSEAGFLEEIDSEAHAHYKWTAWHQTVL